MACGRSGTGVGRSGLALAWIGSAAGPTKCWRRSPKARAGDMRNEAPQSVTTGSSHLEARAKVESLLVEGLRSGPPTPMTPEDWDDIRREVSQSLARRGRNITPDDLL